MRIDMGTDSTTTTGNQLLAALAPIPQWVLWRSEQVDGRLTKVPYQPNGKYASSTNPATWSSYADASAAMAGGGFDGLGFVLTASDPFTCIDLDATDDTSILARQAQVYNELFPTAYVEFSPSGRGAHLWVRGTVDTRKGDKIEVYSAARYMTVTFRDCEGRNLPLPEAQTQLDELIAALDRIKPKKTSVGIGQDFPELRTDDEVRSLVLADAVGAELWSAKPTDWKPTPNSEATPAHGYSDQSKADGKLATIIAGESGNREQTVRVFLQSGLGQRNKAKRLDYQERTFNVMYPPVLPLSTIAALERKWQEFRAKQLNPRTRIIRSVSDIPLLSEYGDIPTDYIIPGFLVGNAITLITGTYGGGKSTITSVFAEAISAGGAFLDRPCKQREVLYLDRENPLGVVKKRFDNFRLNQANPFFHYFGQFTGSEVPQPSESWIVEWAQSLAVPPVIIVDGFTAFLDGGNENDPAITRSWFNSLKPLIKAGCAVVVFHHTGKGDSTKPFRGGTDIAASIDNGFMLESTYNDDGKFDELVLTSFDKMRYQVDTRIEFRCVDGVFVPKTESNTTNIAERGELYKLLLKANGWSKSTFEKEATKLGVSQLKIRSFLNDAFAQKVIEYKNGLRNALLISLVATKGK